MDTEKVDVAVNIFAKPYQTALALLSLQQFCGQHINKYWLQFEPIGSKFDKESVYKVADYLRDDLGLDCHINQPTLWLARQAVEKEKLQDKNYRKAIRYEAAFEESQSRLLFIMHNDVFIYKDIIGALKTQIGDAFICGSIGQCWNCPAANEKIMAEVMGEPPCSPLRYQDVLPTCEQLCQLYRKARQYKVFARPYDEDNFCGEFQDQPWPLPECRVNEWACLINLEQTRPLCAPLGNGFPPGAFRLYAGHNLDTAVPFFRDMHAYGLKAKHVNVKDYLKHWVGTGHKSELKYTQAEDNAKRLLQKHYPKYLTWLKG